MLDELMFGREQTKDEWNVSSLLWMGRFNILMSFPVVALTYDMVGWVWIALVMLAVYPVYLVVYWDAVRVRRVEAVIVAVISVALGVLYAIFVPLVGRGST